MSWSALHRRASTEQPPARKPTVQVRLHEEVAQSDPQQKLLLLDRLLNDRQGPNLEVTGNDIAMDVMDVMDEPANEFDERE